MKLSSRARNLTLLGGVLLAATLLDQLSKYLVRTNFALYEPVNVIPSVFQLLYIQNRGAAFGMFQGTVSILTVVALAMIVGVVLFFWFAKKVDTLEAVSLSLIVAGAVGNLIDRITLGFVTDFFYIKLIDFPVFNVADMFVTAGTICFAIWALRSIINDGKEEKAAALAAETSAQGDSESTVKDEDARGR